MRALCIYCSISFRKSDDNLKKKRSKIKIKEKKVMET